MRGQSIAEYALVFSVVLGVLFGMRLFITRAARDVSIKSIMQLANRDDFALNNYTQEKTYEKAGEPITENGESGTSTERIDFLPGGEITRQVSGTSTTIYRPTTSRGD